MGQSQLRHPTRLLFICLTLLSTASQDRHRGWSGGHPVTDSRLSPPPLPTMVVLPDTQYYAARYPEVLLAQTHWIMDQRATRNIMGVIHLGDVVDEVANEFQWKTASAALRLLDGWVPYVIVPGNHDTDHNRAGPISSYFAPATMPWVAGTMVPGRIENSYSLVNLGAHQWLVIGIEFAPRDAVLSWADSVLKMHAGLPAIIVTHAYLYEDGSRYGTVPGLGDREPKRQLFAPQAFGYTPAEGVNDGEQIWRKLVLPNPNVRLVLSGHDNGEARLTSRRPDGSVVHQLLSDYQWLYQGTPNYAGGSGYLRILEFDYQGMMIQVRTYSPYLDRYLVDDANQFALEMEHLPTGPISHRH